MNKQITNAKKKYEKRLSELTKKSHILSNIRLITFILILASLCILFENKISFIIIIIYLLTFFFIGVVIYHFFIDSELSEVKDNLEVIEEYISRTNGKWNEFNSIISTDINYINDLNLVGPSSLFEYINMTKTLGGKEKLFEKFKLPRTNKEEILLKQESIEEFTNNFEEILNIETLLNNIKDSKKTDFKKYLYLLDTKIKYNIIPFIISIILSIISIITLILGLMGNTISLSFFILLCILQTSYASIYSSHHKNLYQDIFNCSKEYLKLKDTYSYISNISFKSKLNKECIDKIKKGHKTLSKIITICGLQSLRNNFITYILFNTILSLNFLIIFKYNKLLKQNTKDFKESIYALEDLETYISFSTIGYLKNTTCFPKITDKLSVEFKNIKHPLLEEKKCIANTFNTKDDINIITGSNMSGKTSFMKTIGVNLVLAYNGSYVNAESMSCSIMDIFTSINVKDDISRGISTFYGELLRIKSILDYSSKTNYPLIIFIDEIFKGTNYNDRIVGAKETLKKLSKINCIVFLTTHDFELCDIKDKKINNYHFSEDYIKNKIHFDYTIKKGKCKTTNAKYLMKQMNIIDN